jgi:hypothetical protein
MDENFQFKQTNSQINPTIQSEIKPKENGFKKFFNKRNLPKTSAILIIVGILIIIGAVLWGRSSFSRSKVDLSIKVPNNIASGEEVILTIEYKNNNRVALNDTHLRMNYPQGTFSLDGKELFQEDKNLGTIGKKAQGEESFKVRFLGEKGNTKNITARLEYRPENINSKFENSVSAKAEINTVLIGIHIEGSEKAVAGKEVAYAIEYENKTEETVNNLRIKLEYPDDFSFKNADPAPKSKDETNIWEISSLKPGEKKTIDLNGVLNGQEMENKIIRGYIGWIEDDNFLQYSQSEFVTQISPAPILLAVSINGIENDCKIDSGQVLSYKINFKNNTDVALSELILEVQLRDSIFDVRDIDLGGKGFFDSRANTITWSGADISALTLLEPNQSGEVNFSIKIKKDLPIFNFNDKNFTASIIVEIQTLTVPAKFAGTELKFENELSCKINSRLGLTTKVYYNEPSQGIYNTGPIPPRVDNLTTYTVHWQITNVSNDLDGARVKTVLPQGINWTNYQINKSNKGLVSYNERTKEVIWDIGKIPAGIGVTMPIYELIFQIGLTPSVNQIGQSPVLINESIAEGRDVFTNNNLTATNSSVNTSIPDDPGIGYSGGRVVE